MLSARFSLNSLNGRSLRTLRLSFLFAVLGSCSMSQGAKLEKPMLDFLDEYCVSCHNPDKKKGKLDLQSVLDQGIDSDLELWDEVAWMLREREMPPEDAEDAARPSDAEFDAQAEWLETALAAAGAGALETRAISSKLAVVDKYCASCHNAEDEEGGLNLEAIRSQEVTEHPEIWEKVVMRLHSRQMPPPDRQSPNEETYEAVLASLVNVLDAAAKERPQPGRVDTFRRLNRTEYQNAIRDLLGLEIDAAAYLPKEDESHGFDNVTVGALSPSLLDRYITAAQKISRLAIGSSFKRPQGDTFRIPADHTQEQHVEGLPLGTRGGMVLPYTFPLDGEYEIEVLLARDRNEHVEGLKEPHEMEILLDRELVQQFAITPPEGRDHSGVDKHLKARITVKAGPQELGVTFLSNPYSLLENKRQPFKAHYNFHRHPRLSPAVFQISITGPFEAEGVSSTPSRDKIFTRYPSNAKEEEPAAREILGRMMKLAYRRSISKADLKKPMAFYEEGAAEGGFEAGIEAALNSILVSPEFLFRIEREPSRLKTGEAYRISDLELANRLSFFLWSSLPDEELLDLAIAGKLNRSGSLETQVRRMLADPKARNLVTNFANQWLHLRNLDAVTPDLRLFPDFDDNLRQAFRKETELFVESVFREDASVLDLLKGDYTFLNERLAHHYGIPNVFGSRFRRVELDPKYNRGGLLRQGSILTVTSYATRTSPVIRGNWVLENIIGTPAPPPPPDTPTLEANQVDQDLPMRERLAEHRDNPACASCHYLMDPIGFALENYDAVGRWREYEDGVHVDASGGMPDGTEFVGVDNLEKGMLERSDLFVRAMTSKLLTFALGRGVETYDAPALREILREAETQDYRFSSIIIGIAKSVPFQMRAKLEGESVAANTQ